MLISTWLTILGGITFIVMIIILVEKFFNNNIKVSWFIVLLAISMSPITIGLSTISRNRVNYINKTLDTNIEYRALSDSNLTEKYYEVKDLQKRKNKFNKTSSQTIKDIDKQINKVFGGE